MEEASEPVDEMCLDTGYDMGCDATGPMPSMAHDDAGPSHRFSPSMVRDDTCPLTSSTTSPLPSTRTCPLPTIGTAPSNVYGRDEMRFMLTPRRPTPDAVPP